MTEPPEREESDVWMGPGGRTILYQVHPREACAGRPCVLHNPSNHHMRDWPTYFRSDKHLMERICPHFIGHPDPDDLEFHIGIGEDWLGIHGCDGCCVPPDRRDPDL